MFTILSLCERAVSTTWWNAGLVSKLLSVLSAGKSPKIALCKTLRSYWIFSYMSKLWYSCMLFHGCCCQSSKGLLNAKHVKGTRLKRRLQLILPYIQPVFKSTLEMIEDRRVAFTKWKCTSKEVKQLRREIIWIFEMLRKYVIPCRSHARTLHQLAYLFCKITAVCLVQNIPSRLRKQKNRGHICACVTTDKYLLQTVKLLISCGKTGNTAKRYCNTCVRCERNEE